MDIDKALRELYEEKKRLDAAIAHLEARGRASLAKPATPRKRKSMTPAERLRVSERMTQYWEARRARAGTLGSSLVNPTPDSAGQASSAASAVIT